MAATLPNNPPIPTLYKYEPFTYEFDFPTGYVNYSNTLTNTSSVLQPYCLAFSNSSNVGILFKSTNGLNLSTTADGELLSLQCSNTSTGDIISNYPIYVVVNPGRLTLPGLTSNFVLYRNEPFSVEIDSVRAMSNLYANPTLPLGLTFSNNGIVGGVNQWFLKGTPTATYAQANYTVVGQGSNGEVTTLAIRLQVNPERIFITGTSNYLLTVGQSIGSNIYLIAGSSGALPTFSYTAPPTGLSFAPQTSTSITLSGTPTVTTAYNAVATNGLSNVLRATAGGLSNTLTINYAFTETVLFDNNVGEFSYSYVGGAYTASNLYSNVPVKTPTVSSNLVVSGGYAFYAASYFGPSSQISDIVAVGLRSDLSLSPIQTDIKLNRKYVYLTGTPSLAGQSSQCTLRAYNSNGTVSGDILLNIPVATDTVTVSSNTSGPFTFVIGRPVNQALTSVPATYPYPISFTGSSSAFSSVFFSVTGLPPGISYTTSNNTMTLAGVPTTVVGYQTVTVTVSDALPTSTSTTFQARVIDDSFTFASNPYALSIIQNVPIPATPILVTSTLSGLPILSFLFDANYPLPDGIKVSPLGVLTGTPISNTTITSRVLASTGYSTQYVPVNFTSQPDSILFYLPNGLVYTWSNGLNIPIKAISYSEYLGSNFTLSPSSYGLTVTNGGILGGTLTDGIPPNVVLPPLDVLTVSASVGLVTNSFTINMYTQNALIGRAYLTGSNLYTTDTAGPSYALPSTVTWASNTATGPFTDIKVQSPTVVDSNVWLACRDTTTYALRSTDGRNFTPVPINLKKAFYSNQWYGAASSNIYTSPDALTWSEYSPSYPVGSTPQYLFVVGTKVILGANDSAYTYTGTGGWVPTLLYPDEDAPGPTNVVHIDNSGTFTSMTSKDTGIWISFDAGQSAFNVTQSGLTWIGNQCVTGDGYWTASVVEASTADNGDITYLPKLYRTDQPDTNNQWVDVTPPSQVLPSLYSYAVDQTTLDGAQPVRYRIPNHASVQIKPFDVINTTFPVGLDGFNQSNVIVQTVTADQYDPTVWYVTTNPSINAVSTFYYPVTLTLTPRGSTPTTSLAQFNILNHAPSGGWTLIASTAIYQTATIQTPSWTTVTSSNAAIANSTAYIPPLYIRPNDQPFVTTLVANLSFANGPTFTSPTTSAFYFLQYVAFPPITVAATGTGTIYLFVDASTLPLGVDYNPVSGTLSGTLMELGEHSFIIYAKDNNGITPLVLSMTVQSPFIIHRQGHASGYTALVREDAVIKGATRTRDNRVLPPNTTIGARMAPPLPPSVVTQSNCPC